MTQLVDKHDSSVKLECAIVEQCQGNLAFLRKPESIFLPDSDSTPFGRCFCHVQVIPTQVALFRRL